jgi:DNA-directed RNA polymerase specialized sigma24 family protein
MICTGKRRISSGLQSNVWRRAYEADPEKRRDLSQDIYFRFWRSFQRYGARCSLRTWVYRVAHHVAASHVLREREIFSREGKPRDENVRRHNSACRFRNSSPGTPSQPKRYRRQHAPPVKNALRGLLGKSALTN